MSHRAPAYRANVWRRDPGTWPSRPTAPLDVYLFLHPNPALALGAYTALTGRAPLPPDWSFGVHVCRHARLAEFAVPKGVREMMHNMEAKRLPYSSVIIEGWDTYDTDTYDAMREIVTELRGKGKKVLVYEACGRLPDPWFIRSGGKARH